MSKATITAEFWEFLKYRKKYWMLPILVVLLLLGSLLLLVESYPALAPFIYAGIG